MTFARAARRRRCCSQPAPSWRGAATPWASSRWPTARTARAWCWPGPAAALRRGSLSLIEESEQRHWCRLAIVAGAPLLAGAAASLPPITARQALVLVTETVLDRQAKPRFDLAATASLISTQIATEQLWCPADPYIRRQLQEAGLTALLHLEDWPPALDVPAWRLSRAAPSGRRAVLGHAVGQWRRRAGA